MDTAQLNGSKGRVFLMNGADQGTSTETSQDEYVIPVGDLRIVLWRRLWVILLVTLVLTGGVVGIDLLQAPTYVATSKLLIGQKQVNNDIAAEVGSEELQQRALTMAVAIDTRPVAMGVIDRLNLGLSPEELLANLSAEQVPETQFIDVYYQDEDPERAAQIANSVGTVFSDQVSEVSSSAEAEVWEKATVPYAPVSPNPWRDGLLGLVLGLMLGVGLAFLLEHLDDSWRSPEEAEQISGVPTVALIPQFKVSKSKKREI